MAMTKDEVNEKFEELKLKFDSYYKFSFTLVGEMDGYEVVCTTGGNAEDIYRFQVYADNNEFMEVDAWNYVSVTKDKKELFCHQEY